MKTSDFWYDLPQELIAQTPATPRDHSRMLVYDRAGRSIRHLHFYDLPRFLRPGDALVINQTKVIPARLLGEKEGTHVPVELLLLKRQERDVWEALVRPGRRLLPGVFCSFGDGLLRAEILSTTAEGGRRVRFHYQGVFEELLDRLGQMPLPPYIHEKLLDQTRYQTVYAKEEGSAAAPTAGLHFTPELLSTIRAMGVAVVPILLHVGLGTFRPVKAEEVSQHHMHVEHYEVQPQAAQAINAARAAGGRCVCVGTTSVRTLETVTGEDRIIRAQSGDTGIFLTPGSPFHATDALITNFHLPESTLLMLVSAFMGREEALGCYAEAVKERYRFFSFGDAMLIL
ncbi:MAG: tRNA preQ1(34) S-adenosylmethionine ribosyltransferase-isomerase QueA [Candidatus Limiplasma sp.]|nr:tRNA preQ1(34) S-adenosylmethionine ribosyltransferase-isomerase QueA [Candidatus Limiplasma sp.]